MTATLPTAPAARTPVAVPLPATAPGRAYAVQAVLGDDPIAHRLVACGLWVGALVERIGQAPFGDPLLFRLHGYRLALRASEAARVLVVEAGS
ncbi:MAG: FeoA domain-containing protein [Planctomycetota bacterium]